MNSDIKGFILLITVSIVLYYAWPAHAEVNVAIGQTIWNKSDNGIWWQNPFPNHFNLESISGTIEYEHSLNDWSTFKIGYADLGSVSSYAEAVADDANYNGHGCNSPCLPLSHWYGYGRVTGAYLLWSPHYKNVFLDLGAWNYRPEFTMNIPDWTPTFTHTQSLSVQGNESRVWGAIMGIGVNYDNLILRYRLYRIDSSDREYPAIYQGYTNELAIGWRF